MIILRKYKSVVFWLIFMSLWIVGSCPCCNEEDIFSKIEKPYHFYGIKNYITWSMSSQKKWTFFKIAITPRNKNTDISLRTRDIVSEEYIRNKKNKKGDVNNTNENEFYIIKKIKDHKLNAYIVGYSDVDFIAGKIGGNTNNNNRNKVNNINEVNNNEEGTKKTYYYVLIKDITTMKNVYKVYEPLFSALEQTAGNKEFTYSIEIIDANTTEVANMSYMFFKCQKLTEIKGLEKLDTSMVKNMSKMFSYCISLESLPNIAGWVTNNATNMSGMFLYCNSLKSLPDISKWNTSNVTNMNSMFNECNKLESLPDISKWDTCNVTDMGDMFSWCNLKSLPNISTWNTENVKNMKGMFKGCKALTKIVGLDKWNTSNVTNMSGMFNGCENLKELPNISNWNTSKVTDMSCIFSECGSLTSLPDISTWNTSNVTNMNSMFNECINLKLLPNIFEWDTSKVENMFHMFRRCENLKELPDISNWNTSKVTDMSYMFSFCTSLKSLPDISKWNTSNVTNMSGMFNECISLISLPDISKWNTNNVTNRSWIFNGCKNLVIKISEWNDNIKKILSEDYGDPSITLDLSEMDISKKKTSMKDMFKECKAITKIVVGEKWANSFDNMKEMVSVGKNLVIKISEWNDNNIKQILKLDYGNPSITLDVSDLDLSKKGENMKDMFSGCKAITEIVGLDKWDTDHVKDMNGMFSGCGNLVIKISKWNKGINEMLSQDYGEDSSQ